LLALLKKKVIASNTNLVLSKNIKYSLISEPVRVVRHPSDFMVSDEEEGSYLMRIGTMLGKLTLNKQA